MCTARAPKESGASGFTLLEVSVSLGVVGLLLTGVVLLVAAGRDSAREAETAEKIMAFKRAIVGDERIVTKESRTDFGYLGDMGSLPASLSNLWIRGSQPVYVYDNDKRTGAGWAGPYVTVGSLALLPDMDRDAWGNPLQYRVQTGTSTLTGQEFRAKIFSYGPDATEGTGDDITAEIYTTEMLSTVVSYVRDSSTNPIPNVPVKMNYPADGVLTTATTSSNADGSYSFPAIPFGNRSVTVEPKLVYSDGTGVTFSNGEDVEWVMVSFTCGTITSATGVFGTTAFFEQLRFGNNTKFNSTSNLAGSGELVTFSSPADVSWSACGGGQGLVSIFPVRIQSPFTQMPDQSIGAGASKGKSFRFRMNNFESLENGTGVRLDMNGVSITVTLSDGSVATFSPVPN